MPNMRIEIETEWVDYRKHGRPFVRRMLENEFVEPLHTEWEKKRMKQYFSFDATEGELLQVRLSDGSWKNDSKHYVRVSPDGTLVYIDPAEAGRAIAQMRLEAARQQ